MSDEETQGQEQDDAVIGRALQQSLLVIVPIAVIVAAVVGYQLTRAPKQQTIIAETTVPSVRAKTAQTVPTIPLKEIAADAGIDFVHENGRAGEKLLPETMGSGVAVFDANNDGHLDLFFVNSKRWDWDDSPDAETSGSTCRLYLGDGQGQFKDATVTSQLDIELYGMGVAAGDIDNDGDQDLFVSAIGENRLFSNSISADGVPLFTEITKDAGVAGPPGDWSTSCGFFDYDNDGLLDLFVANYVTWNRDIDLSQSFTLDGESRAYGPPRAFSGSFAKLYHNTGNNHFEDVSTTAGIEVRNEDTDVPLAKSMGVVFADVNADDFLDIVVSNDTVPNFLFENQQDGTFKEIGRLSGIAFDRQGNARGAMGIDCGFLRNDQTLAIGIGNFANEPSALFMARPGKRQFMDAAMFTGLGPPTRKGLTFGFMFVDVDLDGRLEVFGANGHLEEEIARFQTSQSYAQPPQLFWNAGRDASSELVLLGSDEVGEELLLPVVGRGAAQGDFDEDGDIDFVVTSSGGKPRLFRNDQQVGNDFVRLRLIGKQCSRDAIGAVITLKGDGLTVRRSVSPTHSYLSQSAREVTFGLGKSLSESESLVAEIRWPGGETQSVAVSKRNQTIEIEQSP